VQCRFVLQEKKQNCYRQQVKRRVPTHWIEQCQRKCMIHCFGQCQSQSAENTGFEHCQRGGPFTLLGGAPSFPGPIRLPSSVPFLSFKLCLKRCQKRPSPPYPRSPSLLPRHRPFFAHDLADSRVRRPPPIKTASPLHLCLSSPLLPPPHPPAISAAPPIVDGRGPPTPIPTAATTRQPSPTARPPADGTRAGIAASDRRRGRRLATGAAATAEAAPAGRVAASSDGGASDWSCSQLRERRQQRGWRPAVRTVPAAEAAARGAGESGAGQGVGRQRPGRRQRWGWRRRLEQRPAAGEAASGGGPHAARTWADREPHGDRPCRTCYYGAD